MPVGPSDIVAQLSGPARGVSAASAWLWRWWPARRRALRRYRRAWRRPRVRSPQRARRRPSLQSL